MAETVAVTVAVATEQRYQALANQTLADQTLASPTSASPASMVGEKLMGEASAKKLELDVEKSKAAELASKAEMAIQLAKSLCTGHHQLSSELNNCH